MTTRVYLVRHGSTVLTAEDRFAGSTNVELSDEGRAQATRLARRLGEHDISAVFCSPMRRTRDTASILAIPHDVIPIACDGLREIDHGRWEGLRRSEVELEFGQEYATWEADPLSFAPHGGECGLDVLARALPVLRDIVTNHAGQHVLIVSHKGTIRLILSSVLGIDARGYRDRLDQAPACLNIIDFKDPVRARLMLFNDISHYADHPDYPTAHLSKWWDGGEKAR